MKIPAKGSNPAWKNPKRKQPSIRIALQNINGKGTGGVNSTKIKNLTIQIKEENIAVFNIQEAHMSMTEAAEQTIHD
jgi:hypothetical protein